MMGCRHYQSAIEAQLDTIGRVRRADLVGHLETCSHCRDFYRRLMQLERRLRTDSPGRVTDEQVDRVREAVSRRLAEGAFDRPGAYRAHPARFRLYAVLTAAAALVLISLLGIYTANRIGTPAPDPAAQFVSGSAALQNRMSLWVSLPHQSMQTELKKLTNDARSAVAFLNNCIPANPSPLRADEPQTGPTP